MTNEELTELVKGVSRESFEEPGLVKTSFEHQATWNNRLTSTGGRFIPRTANLEFNPKQLAKNGFVELVGIIRHELVHYHLFRQGLPYKHGKEFKVLLQAVGGTRYCQPIGVRKKWKTLYSYNCQKCGKIYQRKKEINTRKYCCGVKGCGGALVLVK